jgi:hypothetical protein
VPDPFALSSDPDIPTPTRGDLLNLVHGEYRDALHAGSLPSKVADTVWADARRQWDEGHKRDAARRREEREESAEGFPGVFSDIQPSQLSTDLKPGEFGDIKPLDKTDGPLPDKRRKTNSAKLVEQYQRRVDNRMEGPMRVGIHNVYVGSPANLFKNSLDEKLSKLAESNFFMGGGVGVALGAYAFLIGGAPRFGFFLLICSWIVISFSIWKHRFFEGRSATSQRLRNLIVSGLTGIVLFTLWFLLT